MPVGVLWADPAGVFCPAVSEHLGASVKSVLITGVAGFVGSHLCDLLTTQGYTVSGVDTVPQWQWDRVSYTQADICDTQALAEIVRRVNPAQVYHLAGVSFPPDAEASPGKALQINIMGCASLLDAVRAGSPSAALLLVGSSKVYEAAGERDVVDEQSPVAPDSFYAISKLTAEQIGGQFVRQLGMDVRFTRSFNHTGPGQSPRFVCSDWARQIARINARKQEPSLMVGDLSAEIDFSDVRDVVRAYQSIVESGRRGTVYNVCSGRTVPLRHVLDHLLTKSAIAVAVSEDPVKRKGHGPSRRMCGSNERLRADTGWTPRFAIERSLDDLFAYWSAREA
jgi:GDP-4-dehydro-6-deoxy-D-mannose reductase